MLTKDALLLEGFINAIQREIQDNLPSLLDGAMRMLLQLLGHWKTALSAGHGDFKVGNSYEFFFVSYEGSRGLSVPSPPC